MKPFYRGFKGKVDKVVEKGVSAVYGTMATGLDLGVKGVKSVAKGVSKSTKRKRTRSRSHSRSRSLAGGRRHKRTHKRRHHHKRR